MWFKNLFFYRFTKPIDFDLESLENALDQNRFKPCNGQEPQSLGWDSPIDKDGAPLIHVCDRYWMLCLKKQERILPSTVVNEQVNIKASQIEAEQHRKVTRKEKAEMKELVTQDLLPRAFTKTVRHYAYICKTGGYMVLNTSSPNLADEFTSFLRNSVGSLPVRVPSVNSAPSAIMTSWLAEDAHPPTGFVLNEESELVSAGEDKATVKYKGMALGKDHIEQNKALGFQVKKQAFTWEEKMSFVLGDDLSVKRVKFLDVIQDKLDDASAEGAAEKFDAGFAIMALEVDQLLPALLDAFDGEDTSAIIEQ
jgi:recombination associated protein RdgC